MLRRIRNSKKCSFLKREVEEVSLRGRLAEEFAEKLCTTVENAMNSCT